MLRTLSLSGRMSFDISLETIDTHSFKDVFELRNWSRVG